MQVAIMEPESDMVVKRLSVPMGLEELMESLTKEVLRRKPADIYAFASQHFAQLLEIRDQGNYKGSLKKMKKFNSETSRDSLDNSHAKVNPVKVKSATFGAVNRVPKPINRPKSPAPKAFLTKKNSQANVPPKISPRTFNNNNKNTRQDRTKMMMEKRKASKKNYEDTKKKLEVNKQPSELESKKIVEVPRETPRKDLEQRRRSLQYKRNEGKGEKEKLSSRNTNKNKQDEIVKIGSERSRRKSEISKTLKKDIKKSSLKDIDELKSLKMEGKASSRINATDKKNFRPKETSKETISEASIISSNAEISDEVVTQMERQISEVEDANVASNTPKGEELLEVKIEVSGGGVTEEELRKEVIFSNDQLADVVNDDKSNSESINVESEDHDKISEGKIDLFIKNIDDLEKGENNVLIGSVTKEKIVSGVNENSMFATIKEESLPTDDLTDNTEKTDNFLIVDEKSVEIDGSKNLSVTKDVEIINADDENGHLLTEDKLYHDAATKIQSLIKGHLVRKILKENKSGVIEGEIIKTGDQSTLIELTNAENIVSDKLENDEKSQPMIVEEKVMLIRDKGDLENINEESEHVKHTLNKINAIIKIQALVRGYLTRKSLTKNNIENVENKPSVGVENSVPPSESTAVKMDVPRAASIIQAVVRGFLIRRSIRKAVKNNIPTGSGDDKQKSETPDNICKDMKDEQREELTIESVLQGIVEDVEVYKRITTDFLGQEHINYDSERYDNLSRNLKENSIEETKADIGENIVKNEIENELQIFDRKDAFGDDVKPRANSIEKIANVPNYGDEITAKIQSDWQDHRMKRSLELRDLQKPPECDELPGQRSSPDDAKKAATVIQALFRGYLVRKNFGNVDGLSSKKKAFEGKLPTVLEVEGEDSKDFTSNSSDDKKKENLSSGSRTDDQVSVEETSVSVDNSNHSSLQKSRTISDEEVYAILKQLDDTPVPTEEPRRKSKTYTRSLTFDDPSVQQTTVNQLTKSMTCAVGDEFQRLDIIIDNADETISNELTDGSKSVEDPTDISEITSSIKEDVQKLKETLEGGIDIHEISGDKNEESGNIADITKSIGEDVKQLEKTLSQSADIKPVESLTRPVSKDSVTSTDSVDTVIFNDIRKKELSTDNDSKEDSIVDTSTVKLPKLNEVDDDKQNLMHLNVIKEQGDILVDDILDTAKNRLEDSQNEVGRNKFAEIVFSDQKSIDPVTSEKRQSTTSDELRQLWQDEAATTIQANYRGYRVRRHLGKETSTDVKSTEEKVEEEVTKYLNQITEPIRKAFSVDKNNVDEEEKDENDKKETDSKTEKPPDVVYIPLRDYSSEERDTPLLEKPNILDNVASENKRIEGIEDTIHQPSAIQNTDSSDEKVIIENIKSAVEISKPQEHRIDLEVTSNNEDSKSADKDVEEKISACINAIVEPITKKFQPNEEEPVESETETKMVMEKSEPAYQYIPLRDYSEEEKDTDHVVIGLNDNITTSMSILKDDTEDSQNNVVETASEIKNVLESTKEIVEEENNVENVENKTDERNLNHPDAKGSEQSHAIVNPEKKEATIQSHEAYGSKEITEYINSIVEPVKQKFSPHEQTAQMLVQSTSKDKEPEYEYIPLRDYSAEGSTDDTVVLPKSNINIEDAAKEEQHIKGVEIKSSNDNKHLTTAAENFFLEAPQVVHESEVLKADSDESVKGETDIGSINQAGEETNKDKMNVENMENDITENSKLSTKNESEVTFLKRVDDKSNVSTDIDGAHIENSNVDNEKDKPKQKSENIVNMPGVDTDSKKSNELQSDSSELKENASPVTEEKPQFITNGNIDGKSEKDKPLVEQLNNNLEASVSTSFGDNHQKVSAESTEKDSANINDEKDETANGSITSSPSNIEIKSDKIEEVVDTSEQFSDLVTEAEDVGSDLKKLGGKESQFDELKNISEKKGSDMEIEQNEVLENSPKEARNQLDAESDLNLLANEKEGKNLENLSSADTKASRDTKNQLSTESDLDGENISTPITENVARLENKEEDQENISQERQSNDAVGGKQKMEKSEATEENQTSIGYKDVENIGENKNEILKESVGMPANKTDAKDIHPTLENYAGVETKIDTESEHNVRADINTEDAKEEFRDDEKHEARSDVDGSNGTAHNQINDYQSEISKRHPQTLLSEIEPKGEDVTVETDATHNTETVSNTDKDKENAGGITDSELQERIDNIESQIEKVFDKISSPSPNKSGGKDHSNVDNNGLEENMALGDNKDDVDNKSVSSKEEVQKDDLETGDDTSAEEKTQEAINAYNGEHSETITDTFEKVNKRKNKEELEELMKNGSSNLESVDEDQKDINMGNEVGFNTDTDTKLTKEHADNVNGLVETSFASNNNDDLNNGAVQVEDKAMEKEESATAPNLDKIQTIPKNSKTQQSQGEESITDEQNDEIKLDDIKAEATETYNIPESIIADQENEQSHKNGAPQDSDKIQSPHDAESALTMIAPGAKVNENGQPNFITMPSEVEPHAMKVTELNSAKSGTANAISKIEENIDRQVINENQDVNNDKLNIVEMTNNTKLEHDQIANANKDSKMSLQEKAASDANIELDNMRKADEHRILPEKQSELSVVNSKGKLSENDQTKLVEREETEAHDTKTIELTADSEISRVNTTSSELDANTPKTVILEEKKGHITEERNGDANGENNLIEVNQNKEPQHDNDISKNSEISNNEKIEPKSDIVLDNLEKIVTSGTEDKTDKDEETSAVTDKIQARTVKEAINLIDSKDKIIDNDELLSTIPIEASNNSEKPCGEVTDLEPNAILKNVTAQTANNNMITKNKSEENSEIDITQKDQNNEMHRVGGTDASLEVSGIENVEAKSHIIADNMQKVDDIQALNEKVSALNIVDSKDINGENCQINLNMVEDRNKEPDIATTDVDNTQKTAIIEHGETESRTDENGSESNKADPIKMDQNKELESDVDINNKEISGLEKIDVEACSQSDNMQKADKIQESCDKESTLNLINQNTETNLVTLEDFDKTPLNGKAKELNENSERTCVEITDAKLNTETGNTAETPIPGKENVGSNGIDDNDDTGEEEDGTSVMEVDQNKKLHHDQTTDVSHDTEISEAKKVNSGSNDDLDNQVVSSVIESSHCKEDVLDDVKSKKETEKIDECEEHIKEELVPDEVVQNEKTESTIEHSQKIIDEPETEHISITNKSVVDKVISDDKIDKNENEKTTEISGAMVASTNSNDLKNSIENDVIAQQDNQTSLTANANAYNHEYSETVTNTSEENNKRQNKEELEILTKNSSLILEPLDEGQKGVTDTKLTKEHADSINGLVETAVISNDDDDLNNETTQVQDKAMDKEKSAAASSLDKTETIPDNSKTQQSQSEESITDGQNDEIKLADVAVVASPNSNDPKNSIAQQDNQTSVTSNAIVGIDEAKEIASNINQETNEQNNEAHGPNKVQPDTTTVENHKEEIVEPLSSEEKQSGNQLFDLIGAADGSEQNDKNMLDQVNAINTNLSVESNEKNTNEQKADNFSEPIESINNNNIHDKSKNLELQSKDVTDSESSLKSEKLELNRELSPFYLHQDTFSQDAPSKIQEKKFSETFKHDLASDKHQYSEDVSEKLLHSSEFHDSLPIKVSTESSTDKPQSTQTNGVQCNIGRERSMGTSTVLVHSGELHDNVLPLALQMNQDPGIEIVTSSNTNRTSDGGSGVAPDAQASAEDVSERLGSFGTTRAQSESVDIPNSMDSEKRNNSTIVKKNMESEAATKIQASFRGYQVRKQLKNKLARDNIKNIKRTSRRRSLGRIVENKSQTKKPTDLEEQSATKIQAGIRGFLVRRRQKKNKPHNE